MDILRIGAVGLGGIWNRHLQAVRRLSAFEIAAVCDIRREHARAVGTSLGCGWAGSISEMLERPLDAVVILAPHHLHAPMAIEALEAGCHVLVEKPMANTLEECRAMLAAAKRNGKTLSVCDSASYLPAAVRTGQRFREGTLGRFLMGAIPNMRHYFHDGRPAWFLDPHQSGGGMFSNVGYHRLAVARTALPGLSPSKVLASVSRIDAYPVEACTSAMVTYAGGSSMVYQELGYFEPPPWLGLVARFVFEEGIAGVAPDAWHWWPRKGGPIDEPMPRVDEYAEAYALFHAAIRGEPAVPSAADYAQDVAIVRGAYASAAEDRAIDLTLPDWRL